MQTSAVWQLSARDTFLAAWNKHADVLHRERGAEGSSPERYSRMQDNDRAQVGCAARMFEVSSNMGVYYVSNAIMRLNAAGE